jgi:hypothetical protein
MSWRPPHCPLTPEAGAAALPGRAFRSYTLGLLMLT